MTTGPVRVLVVEDSATQAEEIRLILEAERFQAEVAPSAEAALERLSRSTFDVVISDIVMPGLSGYELCHRIKSSPDWKTTPVLLLTSLSDPVDVIHALECGADSFLTKPCEPEHLIDRVRSLLEARRLRAAAPRDGGVEVLFGGRRFSIESGKEQILDLLVSAFENLVRQRDEILAARDALAAKHAELLHAEQQKEELTSLIVHDLKSPAAGIVMAATSRLGMSGLPEGDRRLWNLVYTSAEVINRMALNLLDLASSTDVALAPDRRTVAVDGLLREVERLMTPVAEGLEHPLTIEVAPGIPPLQADPDLLRRVLQNLVDNALRHSPRGESVRIEADADGDAVTFRVKDRGPGIPPALRDRVFDKYMRVGSAHEGSAVGKGLGLAFCRIAVDAHGGTIQVDDNPPRGSVFTVSIPMD